jgi:glycosyltransferase involved in cell wall biosynthesis
MKRQRNMLPTISIIIPTYNSENTLPRTLRAIKKQTYPRRKIETLVIDGGSTDSTVAIAKKFKCKVYKNPKVLQMYAMQIGRKKAKGKYIVHLDSDEVMVRKTSLENKIKLFKKDKRVKAVILSGILTPKDVPPINNIINEFGEPFSYFI